ncbi:MAG TPA: DUF6350 family protein, partial [Actinopolymorphaceae bacterium]
VAVVVLVGCSALVFLIALALRADRLVQLAAGLRPGLLGTILLVLLCLAFLPNAVLFTMAYVLGPGVALGTQTAVAPSGVELGPLPAFPLLAAVPAEGAPPWWLLAVLAFPFAAGVVAGLFLARRHPLLGLESAALYGGLAVLAGGAGLTEACGLARAVWRRLPDAVRSAVRGGRLAVVVLVGCSALVYLIALATRADRLAQLAAGLRPGLLGTVLLVLLCLAFLPNAVLFTMAYVLGPGVALGTQTAVAPSGVELGPLPAFPLLAAVPAEGAPPWWLLAVLALPFVAGVVAGVFLARRHPLLGLESAALHGGLAGLFGGLGVAVLAAVSGGAAGPGRMADFGPSATQVAAVATLTLTIAGALSAAAVPALREWRRRRQRAVASAARRGSPRAAG